MSYTAIDWVNSAIQSRVDLSKAMKTDIQKANQKISDAEKEIKSLYEDREKLVSGKEKA